MKNAIVQIFCSMEGSTQPNHLTWQNQEVITLSKKLTEHYASSVNADYHFLTEPKIKFRHPTWERFRLFSDEWINKYDNILYLDTDVFTWPDAPNIFELIKPNAFNVIKHCKGKRTGDRYSFNAGVFILNKASALILRETMTISQWEQRFLKKPSWEDSKELNTIVGLLPAEKYNMIDDVRWNMKNSPDAYFTHLWGGKKKSDPDMPAIQKARAIAARLIENSTN